MFLMDYDKRCYITSKVHLVMKWWHFIFKFDLSNVIDYLNKSLLVFSIIYQQMLYQISKYTPKTTIVTTKNGHLNMPWPINEHTTTSHDCHGFWKAKQKYFCNFYWFCLQSDIFFGSLGHECTIRVDQKLSMYVMKLVFNLTK
jgi:hypothetical protein